MLLYKYRLIFYTVQISTNYEKIKLSLFVLSIAIDRTGAIFPVVGVTTVKKCSGSQTMDLKKRAR
jgi:hypothetical protein